MVNLSIHVTSDSIRCTNHLSCNFLRNIMHESMYCTWDNLTILVYCCILENISVTKLKSILLCFDFHQIEPTYPCSCDIQRLINNSFSILKIKILTKRCTSNWSNFSKLIQGDDNPASTVSWCCFFCFWCPLFQSPEFIARYSCLDNAEDFLSLL